MTTIIRQTTEKFIIVNPNGEFYAGMYFDNSASKARWTRELANAQPSPTREIARGVLHDMFNARYIPAGCTVFRLVITYVANNKTP